ncbi:ABC transporter permease [Glycomyces sp. NPDC046736]|uniref:ABC transporter permease n=1 Tax=Glycomyces sp. NPDC046736 TaxID=3155615 RepID=UPI0033C99B83
MSSISPHPDGVSGPAGNNEGSPDTSDSTPPNPATPPGYPQGAMSSGSAAFASPSPSSAPQGYGPPSYPAPQGQQPNAYGGPAQQQGQPYGAQQPYPPQGQQPYGGPQGPQQPYGAPQPPYGQPPQAPRPAGAPSPQSAPPVPSAPQPNPTPPGHPGQPYGQPPQAPGQPPQAAPPVPSAPPSNPTPPGYPAGPPQAVGQPVGAPGQPLQAAGQPPHAPGQVPQAPYATRVEPGRDMPMAGASPIRRNLDDTAELPAFLDSARSDEGPIKEKPEPGREAEVKPLTRKFPLTTGFTALLRHRYSLSVLVRRDLAVKYQATVMGYLWSLIEPLSLALIYWFVFGVLFQRDTGMPEGAENVGYALFIVSGIFAYQWFSSAVNEGAKSLGGQSSLITVMKVPREVFPVSKVFARFAEYVVGFPILIIVALIFGGTFGINLLWLIPAILVQAMLLTGLVFILSAANVLFKDVQRFLGLFMRLLFYASAIIYPITKVEEALQNHPVLFDLYSTNPLIGIFNMHRAVFIPEFAPTWYQLGCAVGISAFLLFFGRWIFYRLEPRVLKAL